MRVATILLSSLASLAACGDNNEPIPTNIPATLDRFDVPMRVGEPLTVAASWEQIDYAHPRDCGLVIVELTCYPAVVFPFTLRGATCEGCTFVAPPDETMLFDGYAELRVIADAPGPVTVRVSVDHAYSDETRALNMSTVAMPRP